MDVHHDVSTNKNVHENVSFLVAIISFVALWTNIAAASHYHHSPTERQTQKIATYRVHSWSNTMKKRKKRRTLVVARCVHCVRESWVNNGSHQFYISFVFAFSPSRSSVHSSCRSIRTVYELSLNQFARHEKKMKAHTEWRREKRDSTQWNIVHANKIASVTDPQNVRSRTQNTMPIDLVRGILWSKLFLYSIWYWMRAQQNRYWNSIQYEIGSILQTRICFWTYRSFPNAIDEMENTKCCSAVFFVGIGFRDSIISS